MWREDAGSHDGLRQRLGVFGGLKGRQPADDCQPLLYLRGIAERGLIDDNLDQILAPCRERGVAVASECMYARPTWDHSAERRRSDPSTTQALRARTGSNYTVPEEAEITPLLGSHF